MLDNAHFIDPPLQGIDDPLLQARGVTLKVLRLDLVHPLISGNKWFKLKHNLALALSQGHDTVLSYGGAYSNHLVALAAAAKLSGLRSIGVVRGEVSDTSNQALRFMRAQAMELHPVSRGAYRLKEEDGFKQALHDQFGRYFDIPEGGGNALGLLGTAEISRFLTFQSKGGSQHVLVACGTAATLAGILSSLAPGPQVLGVSVLKGDDTLSSQVSQWLQDAGRNDPCAWSINHDFHCGGYAKKTPELLRFMTQFSANTGIPLEPVYTGKMLLAFYSLLERGYFPEGSEVIAIHTGGLVAQDNVVNIPT